jgi:hypothetical protein
MRVPPRAVADLSLRVNDPRIPQGSSNRAQWTRWADDKLRRRERLVQATGHKGGNTTHGKVVVPASSGGRGAGASVTTYKLRLTEDDYLVCREWDGTTSGDYEGTGADDVYILKPKDLRCGPTRKAWSEMSVAEKAPYANEAAYIVAVGTSFQSWGTSGGSPVFITYYKMFSIDRSEPFMDYGSTVADTHNKWREESDDYNAGEDLYHRRLSVVRHVYATGGVIERQRVIPVWLKGDVIYAAELEDSITVPTKAAVVAVAEDAGITGEDEIPARAEIPERTVTHLAVGLTSRWGRI